MEEYIQVLTTTETKEDAENIGGSLVEKRLAACVQIIGPIKSIYRWKGKVEKAGEWLCLIKTKSALYERVEEEILKMHPYEVPEIIAVPVVKGYSGYLEWLEDSTEV